MSGSTEQLGSPRPALGLPAKRANVLLRERGVKDIHWLDADLAPTTEDEAVKEGNVVLWHTALAAEDATTTDEAQAVVVPASLPLTLMTVIPDFSGMTVGSAEDLASSRGLLLACYTSDADPTPETGVDPDTQVRRNRSESPAGKVVPAGTTVGVIILVHPPT